MKQVFLFTTVMALAVTTGCATKGFVRNSLDPVTQRVSTLEGQSTEHGQAIDDLENGVSRADERAMTADQKAEQAGQQATNAQTSADQAASAADNARQMAQNGLAGVDATNSRIDSLQNYQVATQETIQFALESYELSDAAKAQLDEVAAAVVPDAPCVIEIKGFTDTTGSAAYNNMLSERRAQAVARYLAAEHDIPLRQIRMLGLGSAAPAEDNATRAGREMNRRVEVKLYVADAPAVASLSQD